MSGTPVSICLAGGWPASSSPSCVPARPDGAATDVDFDPARSKIAPSYSASWLAVSRLVDLYGGANVVAFYRLVASAPTVGQADPDATASLAFPRSFGVTEAQFVQGWKRYLGTLARR